MWRSAELGRSMCRVSQRRWSHAGSYSSVRATTNTRPNKERTRRAMENGSLWHGIDSDEPISFPFVISKGFSLGRRYPYRDGLLQMMLMLMSSRPFFWCRDRGWHEVHGVFFAHVTVYKASTRVFATLETIPEGLSSVHLIPNIYRTSHVLHACTK